MRWNWMKKRDVYQCANIVDGQIAANVSVYKQDRRWLWVANIFIAGCYIRPLDGKGWPTPEAAMLAAETALLAVNKVEPVTAVQPIPQLIENQKHAVVAVPPSRAVEASCRADRFAALIADKRVFEPPQVQLKEDNGCL